jgi:hypothetical protein
MRGVICCCAEGEAARFQGEALGQGGTPTPGRYSRTISGHKFGISGHAWRWPPPSILRRPAAEFLMPPPHRRLLRSATIQPPRRIHLLRDVLWVYLCEVLFPVVASLLVNCFMDFLGLLLDPSCAELGHSRISLRGRFETDCQACSSSRMPPSLSRRMANSAYEALMVFSFVNCSRRGLLRVHEVYPQRA